MYAGATLFKRAMASVIAAFGCAAVAPGAGLPKLMSCLKLAGASVRLAATRPERAFAHPRSPARLG